MCEMQLVNIVSENTVPPAALQPNVKVPKSVSRFRVIMLSLSAGRTAVAFTPNSAV